MLKKTIVVSTILLTITAVMICFRNMHFYYASHAEEYARAQLYLKTDVCVNGELTRKLGDYTKCEESKRILKISPWVAAWYDFLEDMWVCGHGRCHILWDEIATKLPYIILFMGTTLCWTAYHSVQAQRYQNAQMYWQLPLQFHNPRLRMNHQHND
jgi:hypothetical protein